MTQELALAATGPQAAARRWLPRAGLLALTVALPLVFRCIAHQNLLVLIAINVILVVSLDMLIGQTGLISLGHAGFWGVGAYTSALLVMNRDVPFLLALSAAGMAAVLCGLFIGYPSLRLRGHYFVLVTFIFGIILTLLFTSLVGITRGPMGLPGIPFATITLPGIGVHTFNTFTSKVDYYYLVLIFAVLSLWVRARLASSRMGRALAAIREDEDLSLTVGIPVHRYKVAVFLISTMFAGIAGSLYAHYTTFLSPEGFTFVDSFNIFVMNMVGGAGTLAGTIIGPVVLTVLRDVLRSLSPVLAEITFGVFLIVTIAFLPGGLVAGWHKIRRRIGGGP